MTDNYTAVIEEWRKKALQFHFDEAYRALGLWGNSTAGDRKIRFFGREYGISREAAVIYDAANPERTVNFNTAMGIYHLFYYAKPTVRESGEWVPLREIRRAAPFEQAFLEGTIKPFSRAFDGKKEALMLAAEVLGFRRIPRGDVGIEADVFDCMKIRLHFWDGDDEFPAQTNILFDRNANDFLHEETVIMMGMELCHRLKEAGL